MSTTWFSDDEEVWIVLRPGHRFELQAYATKRDAKRAACWGESVFPLTVWREGRPSDDRDN